MTSDLDFMAEIDAARRMKASRPSNVLLASVAALIVLFFLWAGFFEIDEMSRGQGQVVPSQDIQVVQSLEGGILQELLAAEGDMVKKDQVLLRISDVAFASEERGSEAKSRGLRAKKARLTAEANGADFVMPEDIAKDSPAIAANEMALYKSRQEELQNAFGILKDKIEKAQAGLAEAAAQISSLSSSQGLLQKELAIAEKMVAQHASPEVEAIRLRREINDVGGQIKATKERRTGLEAELRQAQKEHDDQEDKFRSQALGELNEVETDLASLEESLKSIGDRVSRAELRSPVDGIVNKIAVKTIGGVIEPAQRLVEIVPVGDDLKIVARVSPQDVAFIAPGQEVNVKITAYDPSRYGGLKGKLVRIGANSVTDRDGNAFFEVEVRTDKTYLGTAEKPLPITPGMVATVEVITGRRTILEYLAKPILRARDWALTER